ncbi:AIR synthase family protein [Chloroflexota bacterium]
MTLPVGKLPVKILAGLLERTPLNDPRVLVGPGIGLDCAVIEFGENLLVFKSDPITFDPEDIGWYAVHVNANDIATTGAVPRWMLTTILLPEGRTTPEIAEQIHDRITSSCEEIGVTIIGGHTEITYGLDRPILVGTMIGEVNRDELVTPRGAQPGDRILLTKGVPIEATAILASRFTHGLLSVLGKTEIETAKDYLKQPGISVLRDARIALRTGKVSAMHDPTEGGLYAALWELSEASQQSLWIDPSTVPISSLSGRICQAMGIDPMGAIASGALLLTTPPKDAQRIRNSITDAGILCAEIGYVMTADKLHSTRHPAVWNPTAGGLQPLPRPERDEIASLFSD